VLRREHAERDPRPCECCGENFTPTRVDGIYCKDACRQKAYRQRKRLEATS
jgi:hypothetical protein